MNHQTPETFDANARAALRDTQLRGALRNLANVFGERRKLAIRTVDDWEALRERARAIKDETLSRLDTYLEAFATNAERAGATVHWARTAEEACEIVLGILVERGATRVVKSKSMATEEIHLNAALEAAGIAPVETDLGEWIIQLADETPSHIVVPAIHKTKRQIAELFAEKVGTLPTDDVAALTAAARRVLRERFSEAEVGISGVNFGVAETGTILVLENEGNARMTTSLPRVHVAVMGIEKIVPRFEDLDVFLKLLPRSGTGQRLTTYQSLITGTKRSPAGEGPDELHIVLMDNGRSAMLRHPVTRQSLACIRCGACLNACPVYQQIGGHAYGAVYPGPIGAVITPQLIGIRRAAQLPFASSLCGACRDVCPVKIDIPELLLHLRAEIVEGTAAGTASQHGPARRAPLERLAFRLYAFAWSRPRLYEGSTRLARLLQRVVVRDGRIGAQAGVLARLAPPLGAWTAARDARPLAPRLRPALDEAARHVHEPDPVGDRVVELDQDRAAPAFEPGDLVELPERAVLVEGLHRDRLGEVEEVAQRALAGDAHAPDVVARVEQRVALPARRRDAERVDRDPLAQPRDPLDRALEHVLEAVLVGRLLQDHHRDDGRAQHRVELVVPEQRVARAHALVVADGIAHGRLLKRPCARARSRRRRPPARSSRGRRRSW
jgi:L-lactate dehydrogenase complex protein LldF